MNARKSFRDRKQRHVQGRRFQDVWDDDVRTTRRKEHRRSRRMTKRTPLDEDEWGVV